MIDIAEVPWENIVNPQYISVENEEDFNSKLQGFKYQGPDVYIMISYIGPCPRGCCSQEYSSIFTSQQYYGLLGELADDIRWERNRIKGMKNVES